LNHDGVWTSGYSNITRYLASHSLARDLDSTLRTSPSQRADLHAFTAYLTAHASPLLDLSLYVSSANWIATTRPAYSTLLSFPLTWTVPTLIRDGALKRTEHLRLGDLDRDFDPSGGSALGSDRLPETVRRHLPRVKGQRTVGGEMTAEEKAAIRLFALVEDCLSGILKLMHASEEKEEVRFFEDVQVSSVDCLAFGYLLLMREAPVPRSFLKDWLVQKTPKLSAFVDRMQKTCLKEPGEIPLCAPTNLGFAHFTGRILDSTIRHVPTIGDIYAFETRRRAERHALGLKTLDTRTWSLALGILAFGLSAGYGVHLYRSLQPFGSRLHVWRRAATGLGRFGEAGALLGLAVPMAAAANTGGNATAGKVTDMDTDELVVAMEQQNAMR
jgi:sorting and assembly machinery component 37